MKGPWQHTTFYLAVVALIYLLCPFLFPLPIFLAYGKPGAIPPHTVQVVLDVYFGPVRYLYRHVPPYGVLIDAESRLFNRLFF